MQVRSHVAPDPGKRPIELPTEDQASVFVGGFVDDPGPVEKYRTRILRSA
ncbi:MAG: hypothetical protein ACRDTA_18175 [Pseudonocardiaceae bacterium]